jgi:hypothetical protein
MFPERVFDAVALLFLIRNFSTSVMLYACFEVEGVAILTQALFMPLTV